MTVVDGILRAAATAGTSGGPPGKVVVEDDFGEEEGMQCSKHPQRSTASSCNAGGICALCLQEKLGSLVSSSSFNAASSSPSFRSDPSAAALSLTTTTTTAANRGNLIQSKPSSTLTTTTTRRRGARFPFLFTHHHHHNNKKKSSAADQTPSIPTALKRSKSAVFPRRRPDDYNNNNAAAHKRGGFWSFLYPHSFKPTTTTSTTNNNKPEKAPSSSSSSSSARVDLKPAAPQPPQPPAAAVDEGVVVVDSPSSGSSNATSFGRKVSRSRSVGCGSRSFSGDFFDRITTGFGDCTLRRLDSQRRSTGDAIIKDKVRCAGIFSGFMITSSSSDRLSAGDHDHHLTGGKAPAAVLQGRSKSWRWALASPMRAFGRPSPSSSAKDLKTPARTKTNNSAAASAAPNYTAIPSLLTVR